MIIVVCCGPHILTSWCFSGKQLKKEFPVILKKELEQALKSKDVKADIGEIAKKVIKKLYKDLSFHHPYIIDRIKV